MLRVVILGESGVGKSAFITRHTSGTFPNIYIPTKTCATHQLGWYTSYGRKDMHVCEVPGTASDEQTVAACRNADAAIIFLDANSETSLEQVQRWFALFRQACPTSLVVVCMNKIDLNMKPKKAAMAGEWSIAQGCNCWLLSVLSNYNYEKPFMYILRAFFGEDLQLVSQSV